MAHKYVMDKTAQESRIEQTIRICLRAMGFLALSTCIVFWLSLFSQ